MRRRGSFLLLLVAWSLALAGASWTIRSDTTTPPTVGTAFIPPGSIFCQVAQYIISSPYAYEASLLDYQQQPIADTDYMHPWQSQHICLPGLKTDTYAYYGPIYVDGSGWVERWAVVGGVDSGARFAFLHVLSGLPGRVAAHASNHPTASTPASGLHLKAGDDATAMAVAWIEKHGGTRAVRVGFYHGGTVVGMSGYPWWPQYSGGGPGGWADAHLCLVNSSQAADWFYRVALGLDHPKPKPFPLHRWNQYRVAHHRSLIPYQDAHHHLRWAAIVWRHHPNRLGGILHREQWYGPTRTQKHGYTVTKFQGGGITTWPDFHTAKTVYWRHFAR